jgi:hypothetical protein
LFDDTGVLLNLDHGGLSDPRETGYLGFDKSSYIALSEARHDSSKGRSGIRDDIFDLCDVLVLLLVFRFNGNRGLRFRGRRATA